MKITTRPVEFSEQVDPSRDVVGVNKWARSSRTIGFIMFFLGWFTIPMEVFLRRDFGQRFFTAVNFYAGLFLLLIFAGIQFVVSMIWEGIVSFFERILEGIFGTHRQIAEAPSWFATYILDKSMMIALAVYIVFGSYHLFKIWWRNRTNTALHSFDDGTSRLEPLASYLMQVVNAAAIPVVYFYALLIPKNQRASLSAPRLVNDRTAFANTVVEPLVILGFAIWTHGITSFWLYASAVAVAIHAHWKETAKLNKVLDFRDSVIEAKVMMQLKNETTQPMAQNLIMQQAAVTIKENPKVTTQIEEQYPDLMNIIEEMNRDRSHLGK